MAYSMYAGKEHAATYWKYRISPPDQFVQKILDMLEKQKDGTFQLAVDVGCGSGQGTVLLAKHFTSVVGMDGSAAQLELALKHNKEGNITYRQSIAEELPFADSSADLVTAMSAFQLFDRPRFLQEAHRVLKPGGCLALLCFSVDTMELNYPNCCPDTINQVCKEFYEALKPYRCAHIRDGSIELYLEAYASIPYAEKEWQECVLVRKSMPLSSYMGMVESFSSYQALLREDPQRAEGLSRDVCQRLMTIMKVTSADVEVEVTVRYFYLLASKP
ncbi:putative methyltransferase [Aulostomus maculatus]